MHVYLKSRLIIHQLLPNRDTLAMSQLPVNSVDVSVNTLKSGVQYIIHKFGNIFHDEDVGAQRNLSANGGKMSCFRSKKTENFVTFSFSLASFLEKAIGPVKLLAFY
jgi:hypothetical protein